MRIQIMSLIHHRMTADSGSYDVKLQPISLIAMQEPKPAFYLAKGYKGPRSSTERRHLLYLLGITDLAGFTDAQLDQLWQVKLQEARAGGAPGKSPQKKISPRERFEVWLVTEYRKGTSDKDIRSKLRKKPQSWREFLYKGAIRQQVIAICKNHDWDEPPERKRGRKPGKSGPKRP
jgi:hypothetical protein